MDVILKRLDPKGIHPREVSGVKAIEDALSQNAFCRSWFGFTNLSIRNDTPDGQRRELDVVLVTHDRILVIDLKDWDGAVTSNGGIWYLGSARRKRSAATKINENSVVLRDLLAREVKPLSPTPHVEGHIVFTHKGADISGLPEIDKANTRLLRDFLHVITNQAAYEAVYPLKPRGWRLDKPLTWEEPAGWLRKWFTGGGAVIPREASFEGYVADGPALQDHGPPAWKEYRCENKQSKRHGLLRYWDCERLPTPVSAEGHRRAAVGREGDVLAYLEAGDDDFAAKSTLPLRHFDPDYGMEFWQVFDLRRSARRLLDHLGRGNHRPIAERLELLAVLLTVASGLHRLGVAHRDLGRHSLWFEPDTGRIRLSAFGAAAVPGQADRPVPRADLLLGGAALPGGGQGTEPQPLSEDVLLLGMIAWRMLTGEDIPSDGGLPRLPAELHPEIPPELAPWFRRALERDPDRRFTDAPEMHADYDVLTRQADVAGLWSALSVWHVETLPYLRWMPTALVQVPEGHGWVSGSDAERVVVVVWAGVERDEASGVRLLALMSRADRLRRLGTGWTPEVVDFGWGKAGAFVVTRQPDGRTLDQLRDDPPEEVIAVAAALIRSVQEMHGYGIVHGSLSSEKILVVGRGDDARPVLDGLFRLSATEDGAEGPSPVARDALAVAAIVAELLARAGFSPEGPSLGSRLIQAAGRVEQGHQALDGLLRELERTIDPKAPEMTLAIGVIDLRNRAEFLGDNREFHVVIGHGEGTLEIFGFDQKLRLRFESDRQPSYCELVEIQPHHLNWAKRYRVATIRGVIQLQQADRWTEQGLYPLLELPAVAEALDARRPEVDVAEVAEAGDPAAEEEIGSEVEAPPPLTAEASSRDRWHAVIAAEEEALPYVIATGGLYEDQATGAQVIDVEPGEFAYEFANRDRVKVTLGSRRIGDLDVSASKPTRLVLRQVHHRAAVASGDRLELREANSRASFERRQMAVTRIVADAALMPRLVDYFDERLRLDPVEFPTPLPDKAELERYRLNDEQGSALREILRRGPVGLLQGPPGTGKSLFIGALVHWAVRRGGMPRILVVSQGHEAANNVAERILKVSADLDDPLDLLRVGQAERLTGALLPHHADQIRERLDASLSARTARRVIRIGADFGLPPGFCRELVELESSVGRLEQSLERRRADLEVDDAEDRSVTERTLASLTKALEGAASRWTSTLPTATGSILASLVRELMRRHDVDDFDAVARLSGVIRLSWEWSRSLAGRSPGMEEFLTRTRSVVVGTCVGIGRPAINVVGTEFDLVVIDEAARCDPGELAVALQSARRAILVGDHRQLPPLYEREVAELAAKRLGLVDAPGTAHEVFATSEFERAFRSAYGSASGQRLRRQYRMAPAIRKLVSACFYPDIMLKDGRGPPPAHYARLPAPLDREAVWLDTSRESNVRDRRESGGFSRSNATEVRIVMNLLRELSRQGGFWGAVSAAGELKRDEPAIGVIAMYAAQKKALQAAFEAEDWSDEFGRLVRIDTIDSYQGKENRIVIVSLVRHAPGRVTGHRGSVSPLAHASDFRRVNVALSRAMERLVIVGSLSTFERPFEGNALLPVARYLWRQRRILPASTVRS
ncbi:hypothetical protein EAH89_15705 [Roseomonas nepalensis]|uniref:Protein kinase domain-containing protein n=1 Tax=Muricoccus nepalensis TaxID=1854500 RepID=A0A502FW24_9PROT|nr:AAA domain-containing protein [Roseomonas nepalensis]TPG53651.1 hypothetical protein EAH89_15705 [Roseomonas nepalensis]